MTRIFREGPIGALMDEYERAAKELKYLIKEIDQQDYIEIVDNETTDPDCKSIQTIMNHVVRSGYGYANYIRRKFTESLTERKDIYDVITPNSACDELDLMMNYTTETLMNKMGYSFEEMASIKINSNWGQEYDLEQLLEHAIVHILRHRRQIEKFLAMIRTK
ncbi:MAG: hypothetical protein M5R37_00610 [Melioribacteraceae bacterium]|nr:hypothetical protein [Melioribacteraceae bacterium]